MALFKIFKGTDISKLTNPAHEEYVPLKDGYCYFDTTTGLFFIDAEVVKENGTTEIVRAPINANRAIYDVNGNKINETYLASSNFNPTNLGIAYCEASIGRDSFSHTASIPNFILKDNSILFVRFADNVQMNSRLLINDNESKPIYFDNTPISNDILKAGDIGIFVYTNNRYELLGIHNDIVKKANLNSPNFSGIPTAPTPAEGDSSTQIANTQFITNKLTKIVDGASEEYNTLKKLEDQVKLKVDQTDTIPGELVPFPTPYEPPEYTAYGSGLYKITTNKYGHVAAATAVNGHDIENILGYTPSDNEHTHLYAGSLSIGGPANSVKESLSFAVGGVEKGSYNGSEGHRIEINAIDLNISAALRYIGRTNNEPTGTVITLVSGSQVIAEPGNVVIWTQGNIEYLLDDDYTWVQLGEASSFALAPHIHGNISNQGYITDEEGNSLANRILISDGTGYIEGGIEISNILTQKFLNENGTWQSVNTDNFYHSTGTWSGADSLTYIATANGGAPALTFTLPTASSSAKGVIKAGNNISISQGTISITKENVESALGFTPLANTTKYALSDAVGGDALAAKKLAAAVTINGMSFDGSASVNNYGVCGTAAATVAKTVTVGSTFSLIPGAQVVVKFTYANSAANPTLNVNSTGAKPIYRYGTTAAGTGTLTNGWTAGAIQRFTYDGTGWIMDYWYNSTYYNTAVTCNTAAATAAKVGSTSYYTLANNRYFIVMLVNTNTAASALTLNINSNGAKPIYINGSASSASNYTLPKGIYLVYYNGTNYYFRTDGGIQGGSFYGTASSASTASKVTVTATTSNTKYYIVGAKGTGSQPLYRAYNSSGTSNTTGCYFNGASGVLYGAAWNDYAEYRITKEEIEPGRCVIENGDDTLSLSTARLQRGCEIVSDTFGFAIGETEESKTPIAATGRVLCYLLEGREEAKSHIGWPVCSGPDGTVSIMTEEEEEKYPSRIIGTISAVPDYEEWGSGNIKVNGRIWIRIK